MSHRSQRLLSVGSLARVEGEGAIHVTVEDGEVREVRLSIYEPPRFFEALLRGRHFTEPVDITARICGICPVAYQMTACQAIEAACGTEVSGQLAQLRCCSTAASGSRATPCTSTCCTPPTSWAFPTR
jgi:sulfhydrogenase subunit alpha